MQVKNLLDFEISLGSIDRAQLCMGLTRIFNLNRLIMVSRYKRVIEVCCQQVESLNYGLDYLLNSPFHYDGIIDRNFNFASDAFLNKKFK